MKIKANRIAAAGLALCILAGSASLPVFAVSGLDQLFGWLNPGSSAVEVEEIVLGAYYAEMNVGTQQQLHPTVLPENAAVQQVSIASEDTNVVQVDENGIVSAVGAGTTRVRIAVGSVEAFYTITVHPDPSTVIADLDISAQTTDLKVGETVSLQIAIMPQSAQVSSVTFTSSNNGVATVNSFGKVTAVGPGTARITVAADSVSRSIDIHVGVKNESITASPSYVVLKPGESVTVKGTVRPSSAPQSLTFRSLDSSVATVSGSGRITAVGVGSTSVILSNGYSQGVVTVIVNQNTSEASSSSGGEQGGSTEVPSVENLADKIRSGADDAVFEVDAKDLDVFTSDILAALHGTNKTLTVKGGNYTISVNGADLRTAASELSTNVVFTETKDGYLFAMNDGGSLPGRVTIVPEGIPGKYLYLYNNSLDKWQQLNTFEDGVITLDTAGLYLIAPKKFTLWGVNWWIIGACAAAVVACAVAYIVVKKRYWFW